jgi:hypothetical protein
MLARSWGEHSANFEFKSCASSYNQSSLQSMCEVVANVCLDLGLKEQPSADMVVKEKQQEQLHKEEESAAGSEPVSRCWVARVPLPLPVSSRGSWRLSLGWLHAFDRVLSQLELVLFRICSDELVHVSKQR